MSSDLPHSRRKSARRPLAGLCCALLVVLSLAWAIPARARVFLSVEDALELAFPGCAVERDSVFLTAEELARAEALADRPIGSALVYAYRASCPVANGEEAAQGTADADRGGTAYFDSHRVRTLGETLMVVVSPSNQVARIEILTFDEPEDYIPRQIWYDQFDDQPLSPKLDLGRDIRAVTGASLTARATTDAVRRTLALHRVIGERATEERP